MTTTLEARFLAVISHELRTPLTSIKGYVDLLIDGDVGPIGEEQREFLGIVKNNADRLVGLVNDLLDVSRIQHGRLELRLEPVDLAELAEQALAHFQHSPHRTPRHTLVLDAPAPVVGTYDPALGETEPLRDAYDERRS